MSRWVGRSDDLVQCLEIRRAVFIEEQGVSVEDEVDGQDSKALHFLVWDNTVPVGTARILILDEIGKLAASACWHLIAVVVTRKP
jgi:predicted GNAT family N-acyltransferase